VLLLFIFAICYLFLFIYFVIYILLFINVFLCCLIYLFSSYYFSLVVKYLFKSPGNHVRG